MKEVTTQRACHRLIPTVRELWPVEEAICGNLPIAGEDMLQDAPQTLTGV